MTVILFWATVGRKRQPTDTSLKTQTEIRFIIYSLFFGLWFILRTLSRPQISEIIMEGHTIVACCCFCQIQYLNKLLTLKMVNNTHVSLQILYCYLPFFGWIDPLVEKNEHCMAKSALNILTALNAKIVTEFSTDFLRRKTRAKFPKNPPNRENTRLFL